MPEPYEITRKQVYSLIMATIILLGLTFALGVRIGYDASLSPRVTVTERQSKTVSPVKDEEGLTYYEKIGAAKKNTSEIDPHRNESAEPSNETEDITVSESIEKTKDVTPESIEANINEIPESKYIGSEKTADDIPPAVKNGYAVQVGTFSDMRRAKSLEKKLAVQGYPVYISKIKYRNLRVNYRVRVGPFATRTIADHIAARLKENERRLDTWVVKTQRE